MKNKIIGFFVVLFLISSSTTLAIELTFNEEQQVKNKFSIKTNPVFPTGVKFMKTFGGYYNDHGYCVQQTTDGGYIITGYTYNSYHHSDDVLLIKTDSKGKATNKAISSSFLVWFYERFPNAFPILRYVLRP